MTTQSAAPLICVNDLCFSRNDVPVFGPVSFAVDQGEALLIEGGNGVGKTTLLRVLAGLLHIDTGSVQLLGAAANPSSRARNLSYLGHLPGLKGDLTVLENLRSLAALQGSRDDRNERDALERVGLLPLAFAPFRQLSAGQRKRLGLARIWRSPARIWLLDEPYANLDLPGIQLVNELIAEHVRENGCTILTSHGAYAAPPVRTRVLQMTAPVLEAEPSA